jgi:hypothetical protein
MRFCSRVVCWVVDICRWMGVGVGVRKGVSRKLTKSNSLINPGVLLGFHWVVVVASWTNGLCIGVLGL